MTQQRKLLLSEVVVRLLKYVESLCIHSVWQLRKSAEIVASIHAATDGKKAVLLCLSRKHIFRINRKSNLLSASPCDDVDVKNMLGCSIEPRRGLY